MVITAIFWMSKKIDCIYFCNVFSQVVNYSESRSVEEICEHSSKLITLIDLAGHHKYMKTTIFGLTCYSPDFTMLVVSANTGMGKWINLVFRKC